MTGAAGVALGLLLVAVALAANGLTRLALADAVQRGVVDHPNERSSHDRPVPSGGGVGVVAAVLLGSVAAGLWLDVPRWWSFGVLPAVVVLAGVGRWDDARSLSPGLRFVVQLGAVAWLLVWTGPPPSLPWLAAGFGLLWVTNLTNFMDGSHGLAAGQGVFAGVALAALYAHAGELPLAAVSAIVAAACAGFLPLNSPRPRVFMGDVGSVPLGFMIGGLTWAGWWSGVLGPAVIGVMAVFVTDASLTLLQRMVAGQRWYTPHKQHLYQRLIEQGWSHRRVLWTYQFINLALVAPVIALSVYRPSLAWPLTLGLGLLLVVGWLAAKNLLEQLDD